MSRGTPSLVTGSAIAGTCAAVALVPRSWLPYDPLAIDPARRFADPTWRHPLGTDVLGRDVLSLVAAGTRATLGTALGAVALAVTVGAALGIAAATWPRSVGTIVRQVGAIALAMPSLLVALVLVAAVGPGPARRSWPTGRRRSSTVATSMGPAAGMPAMRW